jgi:DNA (cytosine-5)-methyltransferase 1
MSRRDAVYKFEDKNRAPIGDLIQAQLENGNRVIKQIGKTLIKDLPRSVLVYVYNELEEMGYRHKYYRRKGYIKVLDSHTVFITELFGGLGAPRLALKYLDVPTEVVDYIDFYKYAVQAYNLIHDEQEVVRDILDYHPTGSCDIIFSGSPCQDFSSAGLNAGGEEGSGTRSSLLWETVRIAKEAKPKFVVFENVSAVVNKRHIGVFEKFLSEMKDLGYKSNYKIISPVDFDVPQSRSRVFVVFTRNDLDFNYEFTETIPLVTKLQDLLEPAEGIEFKHYLTPTAVKRNDRANYKDKWYHNEVSRCLVAKYYKKGKNNQYVEDERGKRALTPKEAARLMSIKDEDYMKIHDEISDTQKYQVIGNSMNVEVMKQVLIPIVKYLGTEVD